MNLQKLFLIHSLFTLAAAVVLIIAPAFILATVDININGREYVLCYFLAAAELAVAYLSFFSRKIKDKYALQIICGSIIIFHAATALLELYAFSQGLSYKIIGNIMLRIIIVILFWYYGLKPTTIA